MMRKAWLLVLSLAVVALTGCSSDRNAGLTSPQGTVAEELSVQAALADAPEIVTDGLFDAGTSSGFGSRPDAGNLSAVGNERGPSADPQLPSSDRRWWRSISDVSRSFDYEFTAYDVDGRPRLAHVVAHQHFTGTLFVTWAEMLPSSTRSDSVVPHHFEKPLQDDWVRHLWLTRVPAEQPGAREWRLVAASGVGVTSGIDDGGAEPHVESVRVQAGDQDTTFSDPASDITWRKLWCAPAGTLVTVTVTTDAPDDVVVLMHHDGQVPLTANGDNTYSGRWLSPAIMGLKHFGVSALSHAAMFDGAVAYHSNAWAFPYLNHGEAYED